MRRVQPVVDHVRHYRGKRLRPVLLLLTARACGRSTPAHHVLGAVVEMIHTATLVHDDVLDGATVRRHVADGQRPLGQPRPACCSATTCSRTPSTWPARWTTCAPAGSSAQATNRVCEGELCQGLERGNLELTEDDYFDIIDGKTAELIACCCQLGALYSGASAEVVQSADAVRPLRRPGLPDRRRPARPGRRGADDGQVAGHRPGTAEDDAAADPPAAARAERPGGARAADPAGAGRPQARVCCGRAWRRATAWITPGARRRIRREGAEGTGVPAAVGVPGDPGGGHGSGGASHNLISFFFHRFFVAFLQPSGILGVIPIASVSGDSCRK